MNCLDLLITLKQERVFVVLENDQVKVQGAVETLSQEQKNQLRLSKDALVDVLNLCGVASSQSLAPLSYSQQRLWFLDSLQGSSQEYNIPGVFKVSGQFDVKVAEQAIARIIARHDSLRTHFVAVENTPVQVVKPEVAFSIDLHDLSHIDEALRAEQIEALLNENANVEFDLSRDLLIRACFINIQTDSNGVEGLLAFNLHHIVSDGWSMAKVMAKEFVAQYQAITLGQSSPFAPLSIQYSDFAHWQRTHLVGDALNAQLDYWKVQLDEVPALHTLPLDFPRPAVKSFNGAHVGARLGMDIRVKLEKIARDHDMSLFMLLHGALSLVLAKHSNSQDIVIGTPVAARNSAEVEDLIGFFVNTLVLRVNTEHQTLAEYLGHVKQVNLDALAHQDIPFEQLVEHCNVARSPQHSPLFQIMFYMNVEEEGDFHLPKVQFSPYSNRHQTAKFDLNFNVQLDRDGLTLNVEYDTSLFHKDRVTTLQQHLKNLLISITEAPAANLGELSILSTQQQRQLIEEHNQTHREYPSNQRLHELFIDQMVKTPKAIAIVDERGEMSYEALFLAAHSLSLTLVAIGVSKDELIAVHLSKGRNQLIATLAVMMAGGAYLPMEQHWPMARCEHIIESARLQKILVDSGSPELWPIASINVDEVTASEQDAITLASQFEHRQSPTDLAYVIYTSGSTGVPKGVAIEHQSAVNTLLDINAQYDIGAEDAVLAVSALSFDLSVYDCFGLLAVGGKVVFPSPNDVRDPGQWLKLVETHGVTVWNTVPTSAGLLVEQLETQQRTCTSALKVIMMSGDWIETSLPARLRASFGETKLYSLGGATEASIWSIHYPIEDDTSGWKSVPYGKPLSNQRFYILDQHGQLAPYGCVGELCIGGIGVAREYFGNPTLSGERFVQHQTLGEKIYRTGDLGRYLPDGNIEFLGRADQQIKIRGFRIELGEIEQQLLALPEVDGAIVTADSTAQKQQHLVAYVQLKVNASEGELLTRGLKAALRETLPEYMIPTYFVYLDAFPTTANGKVDKKSLPKPSADPQSIERVAPSTLHEQQVVSIWAALLSIPEDQISVDANFFDLGGSSLQLTSLLNEIERVCQVTLTVRDLFEAADAHALAKRIETSAPDQASLAKVEELTSASAQQTEELVI